jgi:hypothetical protein
MNRIHIARGSQQLGQFPPFEVAAGLQTGRFFPTDLGWQEGMLEWKPLSAFENLAEESLISQTSNPDEPIFAPGIEAASSEPQPAWERRAEIGSSAAAFETIKQVLTNPAATFSSMPKQGGFWSPLVYSVILSWLGIVISSVYQIVYAVVNPASIEESFKDISSGMLWVALIAVIVFMPLVLIGGAFLSAAFMHFFLWLVGGARNSFETTFRVLCYTQGSTAVLQLIPICGSIFSTIWYFYCAVIGLAKAHEAETWRVVVAVVLPLILFCGFLITVMMVFGGAAIMRAAGS